jgi:serine/threonine-protein kinase HipA
MAATNAEVRLWGRRIGAVTLGEGTDVASFEYDPGFVSSGVEVAPIEMPLLPKRIFRFPGLARDGFNGLPGMLADSLPDLYGKALIDSWLATQGRSPGSMNAVERLCYVGDRGMGALEFKPEEGPPRTPSHQVDIEQLRELAGEILSQRQGLEVSFETEERKAALQEILRVGSSAGGARAKALIAFDPETESVRSGQVSAGSGYEQWILKFDGIEEASRDFGASRGYGAVEFVYSLMARAAGIEMSACRLLEENGRRHFMTRRFDRPRGNEKLHMQSLAALAHLDYNQLRSHSYEQAFRLLRQLRLDSRAREQLFRRMLFNIGARNQDDHVKNIAFLMDRKGNWRLAPAYDVIYAFNPDPGRPTSMHQMSANGVFVDFALEDIEAVGEIVPLPRGRAKQLLSEVTAAVAKWPEIAAANDIPQPTIDSIAAAHQLQLPATH